MAKQGDFQVIDMGNASGDDFSLYLRGDKQNWIFQKSITSQEELWQFIRGENLELIEQGTHGAWPMRIYRKKKGA